MKILMLSRWYPYPANNGSKIRMYHLIQSLAQFHTVDLISFTSEPITTEQQRHMEGICRRVSTAIYRSFQPNRLSAFLGYFAVRPRFLIDTFSPEIRALAASYTKNEQYDMVIASEIDMTPYALEIQGPAKIFEEIELTIHLDSLKNASSRLGRLRKKLTWWKLAAYMKQMLAAFDGFTTVSENELRNLRLISPAYEAVTRLVPNGVNLDETRAKGAVPRPDTLIYAGALTFHANYDAVDYFLREIFPLIRQKRPGVTFYVTGSTNGVDLTQLPQEPGVIFTGMIENIAASVAGSWVSVVPLRVGGGTRLKVLESLGLRTPVISTSKGVEGLDLMAGRDVLVADSPADFASQVVAVLEDADLRSRLGSAGRKTVEEKYDWESIGREYRQFVAEVAARKAARNVRKQVQPVS